MESPQWRIYNVWHHRIFDALVSDVPKHRYPQLVFFGVNEDYPKEYNLEAGYSVLLEYDLPHYRPELQKRGYCQTTCMYHCFANKLDDDLDFIGFMQYDIRVPAGFFERIEHEMKLCKDNGKVPVWGALYLSLPETLRWCPGLCNDNKPKSALRHYNAFFGTNYTVNDIMQHPVASKKLAYIHTFVMPKDMFRRMMSWITAYLELLDADEGKDYPAEMSPPEYLERCHGLFIALESMRLDNIVYLDMGVSHDQGFKNHVDNHGFWAN